MYISGRDAKIAKKTTISKVHPTNLAGIFSDKRRTLDAYLPPQWHGVTKHIIIATIIIITPSPPSASQPLIPPSHYHHHHLYHCLPPAG